MSQTLASDPKRAWLERALGISFGTPEQAGLRGRLNETGLRVREMAATDAGHAVLGQFAQAVAALKAGAWDEVQDILDEIDPVLDEGLSEARGNEAASVIRAARAWEAACAARAWEAACASVSAAVESFKTRLLATLRAEDAHEPDELDEVGEQLDETLDPVVALLEPGLAGQVEAAINEAGERQQKALKAVLARVARLEAALEGDTAAAIMDDNGMQSLGIRSTALGALAGLRAALAERTA